MANYPEPMVTISLVEYHNLTSKRTGEDPLLVAKQLMIEIINIDKLRKSHASFSAVHTKPSFADLADIMKNKYRVEFMFKGNDYDMDKLTPDNIVIVTK